jgi:GrpB-like predicted nucleotidyltransferase (UPF0157 family)
MKIGLKSGRVALSPHRSDWVRCYRREETRLRRRIGKARYTLEHIGSTAVPGLDAKPIIDMAMMIPSFKQLPLWIRRLEKAGYVYKGEYGLPGRHFFTRGNPTTQHLHVVTPGYEQWDRWLLFRDYLRANPPAAKQYNEAKRKLARTFAKNRDAYTQAKTPVINRLMESARTWRSGSYNQRPLS